VQGDKAEVAIVSPEFNGKTPQQRQQLVWDVLREALQDHARQVSWVMVYGTDELL
jgi:stress-induced morphogen